MKGKQRCKILKELRQQIAAQNDIAYVTSECKHKGDCAGTCPKCESEVRYLERELEKRVKLGKAVTLVGLAAGITFASVGCTADDIFSKKNELDGDMAAPSEIIGDMAAPSDIIDDVTAGEYVAPEEIIEDMGDPPYTFEEEQESESWKKLFKEFPDLGAIYAAENWRRYIFFKDFPRCDLQKAWADYVDESKEGFDSYKDGEYRVTVFYREDGSYVTSELSAGDDTASEE